MPKDIVIVPASGKIELSGSSTHINELNVHSESIQLTGSLQISGSGPHQILGFSTTTQKPRVIIQDPGTSTGYVMHVSGGASNKNVMRIDSTYSSTAGSGQALYVKGTNAYGAPGSATKTYGGFFLAGATNGLAPDSIALMAQADTDGPPNSYAAIFSGSAGGVVGINTMEPTKELQVKGDISASGIVYAEHLLTTDDLQVGDDIFMTDGGRIGDMGGAGNDDHIIFDQTNRRIDTFIDNGVILSVGNGLVGINTEPVSNMELTVRGDISASGDLYVGGLDIYGGTTKRLTFGSINTFIGTVSSSNKFSVRDASTNEFARIGTQAAGGDEYISSLNPGNFDVKIGDPQGASNEQIFFVNNTNTQMEATTSLFSVSNDLQVGGDLIRFYPAQSDGVVAIQNTKVNGQTAIINEGAGGVGGIYTSGSKTFIGYDSGDSTTKYATPSNKGLTVDGEISASGDLTINDGQKVESKLFQAGRTGADIFMSASNNDVMIGDVGNASNGFQFSVNDSTQTAFLYCPDDPNGFDEKFGVGTNNPTANINVMGNIWASGSHGHITASGNISSSGKIITSELSALGDLTIDADGADILLKDGGTSFGRFKRDSSDFVIKAESNNNDIIFKGQDGGATITALTLDMSEAGSATFNNHITASGNISSSGTIYASRLEVNQITSSIVSSSTNVLIENITASGDSIFGNSADDTHTFTGNITASGNISASGTLFGSIVNLQGKQSLTFSSDRLSVGKDTYDTVYTSPNHEFQGNITASGNISASGNIHLENEKFIYLATNDTTDNRIRYHSGQDLISIKTQDIYLDTANGVGVKTFAPTKALTVTGDISASGNYYVEGTSGITFANELGAHADVHIGRDTSFATDILRISGSGTGFYFDHKHSHFSIGAVPHIANASGLTVEGHISASGGISASGAIYNDAVEIVDSSGNIKNRFQIQMEANPRITTANRWFVSSGHSSLSAGTQLATSDPDGTSVSYLVAGRYKSYIAPRACKLIRGYVTLLNYTNDDDIIVTFFKGTAVNDSADAITINQIGNTFAPSMTEDKTYFVSQDFSSGNTLSANDFILVTYHSTSVTSTSYPHVMLNFELQYT